MSDVTLPPYFIGQTEPQGHHFDAWPHQTLLLSIEQSGINWPSSCRNGTCRSCMCQLAEGEVRYKIDWPGLSAEEKAAGCVLPCVAFPRSDVVLRAHVDHAAASDQPQWPGPVLPSL